MSGLRMSMQGWLGYPSRSVLAFTAVLALAVLFGVLPIERGLAWAIAGAIVVLWAALCALHTWQRAGARHAGAAALAELHAFTADLPLKLRTRMPLILVTGDALMQVFGNGDGTNGSRHARVGNGALWLRVDRPQDVPRVAAAAKEWRDGRAPDGLLVCVAPALHANEDALVQKLRIVRQAASDTARLLRASLPGHLAVYQRLACADNRAPQWYGVASPEPVADMSRFDEVIEAAADDVSRHGGDRPAMLASAARAAALASLAGWTWRIVSGSLADATQPALPWRLHGACWIDCGPSSDATNPWVHAVRQHASVTLPAYTASPVPWPLPEPIVDSLPVRAWMSPRVRALAHALAIAALAAALAIWGAAKNNQTLLSRIGADISRFRMIPADHDLARRNALQALLADRDQLDRYARTGVPLRLSFGMYRGAAFIPELNTAIASYQPPPPPPPPSIVTLDSMSLFDPGKAVLKPGSTRALVGALEMIRSNRDKRVVIAGHTDNSGTADGNLRLSVARAASVRDWLVDASGMSATRFAIQGYGDTRPLSSNDTDAGRARNRRVEITLIPDCRDDRAVPSAGVGDSRSTPGQPACS